MYEKTLKMIASLEGSLFRADDKNFDAYMAKIKADGSLRTVAERNGIELVLDYIEGKFCFGVLDGEHFVADGFYFEETGDIGDEVAADIVKTWEGFARKGDDE